MSPAAAGFSRHRRVIFVESDGDREELLRNVAHLACRLFVVSQFRFKFEYASRSRVMWASWGEPRVFTATP